jgi:hypothetical protein
MYHRIKNSDITQEELKEYLNYDSASGLFSWKKKLAKNTIVGEKAGAIREGGYIAIRINKKLYLAHRLAWLYVYGVWPSCVIDHINRDPSDNRIENLRDVSSSVNSRNMETSRKRDEYNLAPNHKGKDGKVHSWRAYVNENGNKTYIGNFSTEEIAYEQIRLYKCKLTES